MIICVSSGLTGVISTTTIRRPGEYTNSIGHPRRKTVDLHQTPTAHCREPRMKKETHFSLVIDGMDQAKTNLPHFVEVSPYAYVSLISSYSSYTANVD